MLGRLEANFGARASYVHLRREAVGVASSMLKRRESGIQRAYEEGVLMGEFRKIEGEPIDLFLDYCRTVNSNIEYFLRDKKKMVFALENAKEDFCFFWDHIGAEGDVEAALSEWDIKHNNSPKKVAGS